MPALDHRFHWSKVSPCFIAGADVLVAPGLFIVFLVFREKSYSSATIEVRKEQRVISTGPYRIVRHPMYAGALLMLLAVPVALSFVGLAFVPPMVVVIVWRLIDEESYLGKNLPGYIDPHGADRQHRRARHMVGDPVVYQAVWNVAIGA